MTSLVSNSQFAVATDYELLGCTEMEPWRRGELSRFEEESGLCAVGCSSLWWRRRGGGHEPAQGTPCVVRRTLVGRRCLADRLSSAGGPRTEQRSPSLITHHSPLIGHLVLVARFSTACWRGTPHDASRNCWRNAVTWRARSRHTDRLTNLPPTTPTRLPSSRSWWPGTAGGTKRLRYGLAHLDVLAAARGDDEDWNLFWTRLPLMAACDGVGEAIEWAQAHLEGGMSYAAPHIAELLAGRRTHRGGRRRPAPPCPRKQPRPGPVPH